MVKKLSGQDKSLWDQIRTEIEPLNKVKSHSRNEISEGNSNDENIKTNINGFFNVINNSNKNRVEKFIYASSSSVYGDRSSVPFFETDNLSKPESIYAATKISNELIAYTYSKLYNLSTVGLRFFTVYGPWGRPDMAYFSFANSLFKNKPIDLYNKGKMLRDFTYIDDIIDSMMKIVR